MKTRILATALMIIFTTGVFANASHFKSEDSLYASGLAVVNGSRASETVENNSITEIVPSVETLQNDVNLEEWVEDMQAWEQESSENPSASFVESVSLTGWFNSRESWEQESSTADMGSVTISGIILENWVAEVDNWEQEVSAGDLALKFKGALQQEWISDRETWEQK